MRVEVLDRRRERLRVTPESEEDLWTIKTVLRPGDYVVGKTYRDVARGGRGEKEKRPITVKLRVKNVEFQPFTGKLRVFGVIVEGPEEYGVKGKHQSILVTPSTSIILEREGGWRREYIERLESSGPKGRAVIVAVDYDEYGVAVVSPQGVKVLVDKSTRLPGKDDPSREQELEKLKAEVAKEAIAAASNYKAGLVVVTGPGALKRDVAERIRSSAPNLRVIVDDASMGGRAGIEEALRRHTVSRVLRDYAVAEAEELLGEIMKAAARDPQRVALGARDAAAVARMGAVEAIVIVDELLYSIDDEEREAVNEALEEAYRRGARVIIVPRDSPVGERLWMMGGVAALLRFPVPDEARRRA